LVNALLIEPKGNSSFWEMWM